MKEPKKSSQNDELDEQALGNVSGGKGELIIKDGCFTIQSSDGRNSTDISLPSSSIKNAIDNNWEVRIPFA